MADRLTIRRTKAGAAFITLNGVSQALDAREREKAAIRTCQELRNRMGRPEGLVTITCEWSGQSIKNGNLKARVDATFYHMCYEESGICPFVADYGGPTAYLKNFFSKWSNRVAVLNVLKAKITTKVGNATSAKLRRVDKGAKDACASPIKWSDCKAKSNECRWRSDIKFCVPEYMAGN